MKWNKPFFCNFGMVLCLWIGTLVLVPSLSQASTCLWVSSYHQGYEWNDGIERGLDSTLSGKCEIHRFFMDTKRNPDQEFARQKGAEAFALMKSIRPDVIIASDDNASRYFVVPYREKIKVPVVFCGINWTVEEYGYPDDNSTGMVEFAPVMPLFEEIKRTLTNPSRGLYLSSDVPTEHTDHTWYQRILGTQGITIETYFVRSIAEWEQGYLKGQGYDFIILGNNGGINDWDNNRAREFALNNAGVLTVSNYDWMMPYTMMAKTKIPDEQGEWAAQVALEILSGIPAADIPIVPNKRWNLFVNEELTRRANIRLDPNFLINAIKVKP